jgi:hypothetical protein
MSGLLALCNECPCELIPNPLASAAPAPSVIAPASSHPFGSGWRCAARSGPVMRRVVLFGAFFGWLMRPLHVLCASKGVSLKSLGGRLVGPNSWNRSSAISSIAPIPLSAQRSHRSRGARRSAQVAVFDAANVARVGTTSSAVGSSPYRSSRRRRSAGQTIPSRDHYSWILTAVLTPLFGSLTEPLPCLFQGPE